MLLDGVAEDRPAIGRHPRRPALPGPSAPDACYSITMPLDPSTRLGPYEIVSRLGAGGMGEVYRARDPRMGRDVAVKVSAERFSERFDREARAIAALNHPNICAVYDVGPNYLVMELIDGPTLAARIGDGDLRRDEELTI